MVIQRTIHHLKQRPHHERRAFALFVAMGVVAILFLGWGYAFFTGLHEAQAARQIQAAQTAAARAAVQIVAPSGFSNSTDGTSANQ